jgi:hypothetical protein
MTNDWLKPSLEKSIIVKILEEGRDNFEKNKPPLRHDAIPSLALVEPPEG